MFSKNLLPLLHWKRGKSNVKCRGIDRWYEEGETPLTLLLLFRLLLFCSCKLAPSRCSQSLRVGGVNCPLTEEVEWSLCFKTEVLITPDRAEIWFPQSLLAPYLLPPVMITPGMQQSRRCDSVCILLGMITKIKVHFFSWNQLQGEFSLPSFFFFFILLNTASFLFKAKSSSSWLRFS